MSTYRECWEQPQKYGSDKWDHYLDIYERHFKGYTAKERLSILEIGVQKGGSLSTARSYFGPSAKIYGVDIDADCRAIEENGIADKIFIGSQRDRGFLEGMIKEIDQGLDIILDDGSHQQEDMIATFQTLFPYLKDGGTYIIEDTHTAYFPDHQYSISGLNVYDYFKSLTDKPTLDFLNAESRKGRFLVPLNQRDQTPQSGNRMANTISSLHFYNSIIAIEKAVHTEPLRRVRLPSD